jgi:hypothetical protein
VLVVIKFLAVVLEWESHFLDVTKEIKLKIMKITALRKILKTKEKLSLQYRFT